MKNKPFYLAFVLVVIFTNCELYAQDAVQTGTFAFDKNSIGQLAQGHINKKAAGNRSVTKEIKFRTQFSSVPNVIVTVNSVFIRTIDRELRYKIEPKYVSNEGFVLELSTSYDGELYEIGGSWLATTK